MKKVFLFVLLIGSISYYNLTAVDVSLGFVGQFAMSGAVADSSSILPSSFRDFDMGYSFLVGIKNNITDNTAISILADLGYYHDGYALKYDIKEAEQLKIINLIVLWLEECLNSISFSCLYQPEEELKYLLAVPIV